MKRFKHPFLMINSNPKNENHMFGITHGTINHSKHNEDNIFLTSMVLNKDSVYANGIKMNGCFCTFGCICAQLIQKKNKKKEKRLRMRNGADTCLRLDQTFTFGDSLKDKYQLKIFIDKELGARFGFTAMKIKGILESLKYYYTVQILINPLNRPNYKEMEHPSFWPPQDWVSPPQNGFSYIPEKDCCEEELY